MDTVFNTDLQLPFYHRGKVRDTYEIGNNLLIIASDRISAFDVILNSPIPGKGIVLSRLSAFWFDKTSHLMPNHLIKFVDDPGDVYPFLLPGNCPSYLPGRAMIVKRAKRIPIECVVRGYLSGSAWKEYVDKGTVSGRAMPRDFKESQELPEPLFTPTTKAEQGHDQPLNEHELEKLIGNVLAEQLKERSIELYNYAKNYGLGRGIIIADTKFEFGLVANKLIVIDEMLTPDSSRFWNSANYQIGYSQSSFDKQPLRDWLIGNGWNMEPPAPELTQDIIIETARRYQEAYFKLTGKKIMDKT